MFSLMQSGRDVDFKLDFSSPLPCARAPAAFTNHHRPGGLKQRMFILQPRCWDPHKCILGHTQPPAPAWPRVQQGPPLVSPAEILGAPWVTGPALTRPGKRGVLAATRQAGSLPGAALPSVRL